MSRKHNNDLISNVLNKLKGWIICNQCGIKHSPDKSNYIKCLWSAFGHIDKSNNINLYSIYIDYTNLIATASMSIEVDLSSRLFLADSRKKCKEDLIKFHQNPISIDFSIRDLLESNNPTNKALSIIKSNKELLQQINYSKHIIKSISPGQHWWASPADNINSRMIEAKEVLSLYHQIGSIKDPNIICAKWNTSTSISHVLLLINGDYIITSSNCLTRLDNNDIDRVKLSWEQNNKRITTDA